jgi:hypothetical protein
LETDINGNFYVLRPGKNMIEVVGRDRVRRNTIGGAGWENDQFDRPSGIWARNGIDVFVADYGNHRIQRFDRNLNYISTLSTRESANPDERFGYPTDVTLSRLGFLYVCDSENSRVVKINQFGQVERTFGGFGAGEGRLLAPTRIQCGPDDCILVQDGVRILVYDNFGNYLRLLGGGFHPPVTLYADDKRVVVTDSSRVFLFDSELSVSAALPVESTCGLRGSAIMALTCSQDSIFVLTSDRIVGISDPATSQDNRQLH